MVNLKQLKPEIIEGLEPGAIESHHRRCYIEEPLSVGSSIVDGFLDNPGFADIVVFDTNDEDAVLLHKGNEFRIGAGRHAILIGILIWPIKFRAKKFKRIYYFTERILYSKGFFT